MIIKQSSQYNLIHEYVGFINGRMLVVIDGVVIHTGKVLSIEWQPTFAIIRCYGGKSYQATPDVFTVDELLTIQKYLLGEIDDLRFTKRNLRIDENN